MKPTSLSALAVAVLLLPGCASIIDGGDKTVRISSNPSGAKVTVSDKKGQAVCVQTTPAIIPLKRAHGPLNPEQYKITFEIDGYYPASTKVVSTFDGWYLGNLIIGGLIGMTIDIGTMANYTLTPRDISINLIAIDPALTPAQVSAAQAEANPVRVLKPAITGKGAAR